MNNTIIICEYGWILIGKLSIVTDNDIELRESSVVRRWSNGKGIGGLANKEYKDNYTLDEIGTVVINRSKVLFEIPCEW